MKPKSSLRRFLALSGSVLLAMSSARAEILYWDGGSVDIGTDGNGASTGGTGTWDTSLLNWDRGAVAHTNWNSSNPDYAVMAGTGATVTVGSGITTSGIDFTGNGYILDATSNGIGFGTGANQIRLAGNTWAATINGAISGSGSMSFNSLHTGTLSFNPTPQINFGGTSTGGWSGATTITRGVAVNLQDDNQALNSTSGITLNGGMINLTNTTATSITNNRINDSAAITVTGGGGFRIANTNTAGQVYSENIGDVTLNSGYLAFSYTTNLNTAGTTQTLTLDSFTRNNHSVVYFGPSANSAGVIQVTGATQTAANEIIGPWALSGNGNTIDDYAVYNASGQVVNRNATANNTETTWSTAWSATANQYLNNVGGVNLTADRTFNTFRIRNTTNNAWSLGDFKLATYGFLSNGNQTINAGTNGFITIPTDNSHSALYLANGNGTITLNAPIKDNGSTKLTLVLTGSASAITLNGDSSYTGGTVIARSNVRNSATSGGSNIEIGHANAFGASTNYLKFDSGILDLNAINVTVGEFSGEASSYITASAGGTLTVGTGTTSASSTEFKGLLTAGKIVKNGDGRLTLSGINTANEATAQYTVNGGTLQFAKTQSFFNNTTANWTKAKTIVNSGGTLAFNVGGTDEFTTGNVTTLLTNLAGSNAAGTEGLQAGSRIGFDTTNAGSTFTIANNIADSTGAGGGAIGLTKLGTGTLELSGASTYTGATLVSAGTLYLSGSLSGSAVTVGADGAFRSTGALDSGLTIAAGGNLDLTGATIDLNSANGGILSLTGGDLTLGNLTFQDLVGWDWLNAAPGTYELIDGAFTVNFGSTAYLDPGTAYDFGNGKSGYFTSGSLNAVIVAVPEPRAALLGGLGLLALLRRRRS